MATELDKQPTTLQQRLTCDSKVPGYCCLMVLFRIIHDTNCLQQLAAARAVGDTNRTVTLSTVQQQQNTKPSNAAHTLQT